MTRNGHQETARIYQFPVKPRRTDEAAGRTWTPADRQIRPAPTSDFGSGWYHDAAIRTEQVHPYAG